MTRSYTTALVSFTCVMLLASGAEGQARAAMLETGSAGSGSADVGRAFDRLARSRLEALAPVAVDAAPPLPLADLQLAVGCVGESVECLSAVARRVGVQIMVVPSVESSGGQYVASFIRFDVEDGAIRRVTRRALSEGELLDQVEPMLRELFDLPATVEPANAEGADHGTDVDAASEPTEDPTVAPDATSAPSPGFPVGPALVAGAGLLAIVGGTISGAISDGAENAYLATDTSSRDGVDAARAHLDEAETAATVANVLMGVGGAVMVGAAIWWLVGADSPFGVSGSRDGLAVTFEGTWGGDS